MGSRGKSQAHGRGPEVQERMVCLHQTGHRDHPFRVAFLCNGEELKAGQLSSAHVHRGDHYVEAQSSRSV